MNVCLESVASCECTPAKFDMIFTSCCREEAQKLRNTIPACLTDCDNDIIINIIVKCGCEVISPCGCDSDGPISFSNLIQIKSCGCSEPEHFAVIITSSNPCTSEALCRCPEVFICDEDSTIKITFLFNKRGSCRFSRRRNDRCNNSCNNNCNNGCGGCGFGWEWLLLLFLC